MLKTRVWGFGCIDSNIIVLPFVITFVIPEASCAGIR